MKQKCLARFLLTFGVFATFCGSSQAVFAQTAVSLDGVDDYVSLPSGTIPDSNLTITMWVKPLSLSSAAKPSPALAYWGPQIGCSPSGQYLLTSSPTISDDKLSLFTGCAAEVALSGTTTLSTGVWQHVALTIDAAGNAVLYLNGVQEATGNARGGMPVSAGNDLIGAYWSGGVISSASHFDGALDELQIYNRVLTPGEISELYNAGQGHCGAVVGGGLVAGYHFDEGSGTSAADFSGNGKTGSLVNGAGWVPSPLALGCTEPATCPDTVLQTQVNDVSDGIEALISAPTTPPSSINPLHRARTLSREALVFLAAGELGQGLDKIRDTVAQLREAAKRGANTTALQQALAEAMGDRVEQAITDVSALVNSGDPNIAEAQRLFDEGQNAMAVGNFLEAATRFIQAQKKLLGAVQSVSG